MSPKLIPALDLYFWSSVLFNIVSGPMTRLDPQELLNKSRKLLPPHIRVGCWYKSTPNRPVSPKPVDKWRKTVDKPTWLGKTRKFVRISHFWSYPYMGGVVIQLPDIFPPCGIRSVKQSRTF